MTKIAGSAHADPNVYVPPADAAAPGADGNVFERIGEQVAQNVDGIVGDAVNAVANATGTGFAYSTEQLQNIARKWEDLAETFIEDIRDAQAIAATEGPGAEYASGGNAELIRASGTALVDTLVARRDYCMAQADLFLQAAGNYSKNEDAARADIKTAGGSL